MEHYTWLISIAVQTVIFLFGVYGMVVYNNQSNKRLEAEVLDMRDELKDLKEVIIQQAVQTEKIENLQSQVVMLQRNIEDLRRGNGFVVGNRRGVDGEYKS
jgi:hypothetical protein